MPRQAIPIYDFFASDVIAAKYDFHQPLASKMYPGFNKKRTRENKKKRYFHK